MTRHWSALVVLGLAATLPAAAQRGSQPTLTLTIFAGVAGGHALWSVGAQPYCVLQGSGGGVYTCSTVYDTLALTREVTSSIVAGVSATYYSNPHIGFQAEIYYLGQSFDDTCVGVALDSLDTVQRNAQVCSTITSNAPSSGAIGFFGGVIFRAAPTRALSPYLRGGVGLVAYSGGTVEMTGSFQEGGQIFNRPVYEDPSPKTSSFSFQVGVGTTVRVSPGYQMRFEIRDVIVPLVYVTGPSDDQLRPPTDTKFFNSWVLTLGLDVILEKTHGRRY